MKQLGEARWQDLTEPDWLSNCALWPFGSKSTTTLTTTTALRNCDRAQAMTSKTRSLIGLWPLDQLQGKGLAMTDKLRAAAQAAIGVLAGATRHHMTTSLPQAIENYGSIAGCRIVGEELWFKRVPEVMLELSEALAEPQQEPSVAWRDHVEQRLLSWRQRFVNKCGDQLELQDFMGQESIDDLLDYVLDEFTEPAQAQPLSDEQAKKLCHVGPVFAPNGVVSRTPYAYRKELMEATLRGLRKGEAAHGITQPRMSAAHKAGISPMAAWPFETGEKP